MKKILLQLLILLPLISLAQNWEIPDINWHRETDLENKYVAFLKLKDKNSLIVKIAYSSHWIDGLNTEYIVYQNNGKIKHFIVYQPNSAELKTTIKRKKIKKKERQHYWDYLHLCISEKRFEIDHSKLNITQKIGEKKGTIESMRVTDGTTYYFVLCQGKNYLTYHSLSPESYIEKKYPGFEERQKLLKLISGFEKLTKKD